MNIKEITEQERAAQRAEDRTKPMHVIDPRDSEDCCRRPFAKAAREGKLDGKEDWQCPKCGVEWRRELDVHDGVTYWQAVCSVAMVRR